MGQHLAGLYVRCLLWYLAFKRGLAIGNREAPSTGCLQDPPGTASLHSKSLTAFGGKRPSVRVWLSVAFEQGRHPRQQLLCENSASTTPKLASAREKLNTKKHKNKDAKLNSSASPVLCDLWELTVLPEPKAVEPCRLTYLFWVHEVCLRITVLPL